MQKSKISTGLVSYLAAIVLILTLHVSPNAFGQEKVLKIGSVLPISGPQATVGLSLAHGCDILSDWINDKGGVAIGKDKYRVQMINEDSKMNPEAAATSATKLVNQDKVKFVIGEILDPCAEAIYGVTAPTKALHVVPFLNIPGSSADVSSSRPLKVRLGIHNNMVSPIMYDYLVKAYPKVKTVVMTEMNIGLDEVIAHRKTVAEQHGIKVLAVELFPLESFDLYPVQTRILSYKPDAIDLGSCPPDHATLHVKAARELGFRGPIFFHSPMDPAIILRAVGSEKSNDVFGSGVDINSLNITAMMSEVGKRWKKKYNEAFASESFIAFDATWTLCQAIEKTQSQDPEAVVTTFETLLNPGSLQTVFGAAYMGGVKTFGVNRVLVRPVPLSMIKNGKVQLLSLTLPKLP